MNILKKIRKYFVLRSYAKKLGPLLSKRYGKRKYYTAKQVRKTVDDSRFDPVLICYAYATYLTRKEFRRVHEEMGEECDYDSMRGEVCDKFYGGDQGFNPSAVEDAGHDLGGGDSGDLGGGDD